MTPFKGVNTEAIALDTIIFDAVYGILRLSSPLYTLGNTYADKLCTAATVL